jgi:hypothetical protein
MHNGFDSLAGDFKNERPKVNLRLSLSWSASLYYVRGKRERMPVSLQKSGRLPRLRRRDIDFDFEGLVGAAIADVVLRKRTNKRKGNWNASPKR